jgi:hypothetical protein
MISTPRGRVDTDWIVCNAPLDLVRLVIETDLIILSGQGIDVILGMSWMKWHKAILDIVVQLVHLNSPMHGKVTLHLLLVSHIKVSLHHVVELKLEEIHVVRELPDVFPYNRVQDQATTRYSSYSQESVSDDTRGIGKVKDSTTVLA